EDSLIRIHEANDKVELGAAAVAAILERWRVALAPREGTRGDRLRELLDRIIDVAEGRFPAVSDLAREVRYRAVEQAAVERARDHAYARADDCLAQLARGASGAARAEHVTALVDCPQPIVQRLVDRFEASAPAMRQLLLEVLTRHFYRPHALQAIAYRTAG